MNQAARRIGRSLALVLPVVLVLSGTLAVARVPWAETPADTPVLPASAERADDAKAASPAPYEELRDRLLTELQREDPTTALTSLQWEMDTKPSLAKHCAEIARALGRAAVEKYGNVERAQSHARPVCDTSYAAGVAQLP